jgi:hypothetical protein
VSVPSEPRRQPLAGSGTDPTAHHRTDRKADQQSEQDRPADAQQAGQDMRTGRAIALAVAVVGLLSLVALASQGPLLQARTHDRQGHLPAWATEVFTILAAMGALTLIYGLAVLRRERRARSMSGLWSILVIVAIAAIATAVMHAHHQRRAAPHPPAAIRTVAPAEPSQPKPSQPTPGSGATWWEVLILSGVALVALGLATRKGRAAVGWRTATDHDLLVALVDDSLEDLRAEPDPRRAVIAAYARMERGLSAGGLTRQRAETALEYLGRVLAARRVSETAATRLTRLFEQAKFSHHRIGLDAKDEAIDALEALRDELRGGRPHLSNGSGP